jgi:hypothetical protein
MKEWWCPICLERDGRYEELKVLFGPNILCCGSCSTQAPRCVWSVMFSMRAALQFAREQVQTMADGIGTPRADPSKHVFLEDTRDGSEKAVENCSFCGERNPRAPDACPHCGRMPLVMVKCVQCRGSGRVDGDVCLRCGGKGQRAVSGSEGGSR